MAALLSGVIYGPTLSHAESKTKSISSRSNVTSSSNKMAAAYRGVTSKKGLVGVGNETRTLSMYFGHTKESITVTYKKNGKFIPSAMKKINYFLRDWRRNEVIRMDPTTIDLLWELHADLGSKKPVHIISGYRSPKTNAMLRRIGRKVAKKSMHMRGRAIDVTFPDVPLAKLRASALVRQVGGVGYYPRSGRYGFVHIDSGNVRHWPHMSNSRLARLKKKYRYTVGARFKNNGFTQYAAAQAKKAEKAVQKSTANTKQVAKANSTAKAPAASVKPVAKPTEALVASVSDTLAVPLPRPRPYEVLVLAAANMQIVPASAPVPRQNFATKQSPASDDLTNAQPQTVAALDSGSNTSAKGSLDANQPQYNYNRAIAARPVQANLSGGSGNSYWWQSQPVTPQVDGGNAISAEDQALLSDIIVSNQAAVPIKVTPVVTTQGKTDRLQVNRSGKGDFGSEASLKPMNMNGKADKEQAKMVSAALNGAAKPMGFNAN